MAMDIRQRIANDLVVSFGCHKMIVFRELDISIRLVMHAENNNPPLMAWTI